MKNFAVYMIGIALVVAGLAYGAHLLGIAPRWIGVGILIVIGLGVMGAIVKTRRPEPS
jgi:hypothetical protein